MHLIISGGRRPDVRVSQLRFSCTVNATLTYILNFGSKRAQNSKFLTNRHCTQ